MILATFIHGMALRFYAAQHTRLSKKKLLLFTYLHDAYILNDHYRYLHMSMVALHRVLFFLPQIFARWHSRGGLPTRHCREVPALALRCTSPYSRSSHG